MNAVLAYIVCPVITGIISGIISGICVTIHYKKKDLKRDRKLYLQTIKNNCEEISRILIEICNLPDDKPSNKIRELEDKIIHSEKYDNYYKVEEATKEIINDYDNMNTKILDKCREYFNTELCIVLHQKSNIFNNDLLKFTEDYDKNNLQNIIKKNEEYINNDLKFLKNYINEINGFKHQYINLRDKIRSIKMA